MDFTLNKIFTHLENHFSNDQNITTLKRKLEELNAVKEDNESKRSVELQPRKKLKKQVEIWFQNVETINGEILNDLEKEAGILNDLEKEAGRSNLLSRVFLGSNVLKRIQEVEELIQRGQSYDGLVIDDPQWIGQVLSTTNLSGKVAENIMKEIWTYLMNDDVSKIGVLGMGGVGKTTIMKLIHNQLLKEAEKFGAVIWTTVSKELNIAKLQDDIVRAMNEAPLKDDDELRRAGMIYEKLTLKGRYVLILDDLWDKLSLEEVGIPEPSHGSKLVVTTRKLDVCRSLDCREVKVPTLPKQDALSLFLEKVGGDILNDPVLSPIVEAVIEQCAGLPLAIVTVAGTMKGKCDIHEWRNALIELKRRAQSVNNLDEKVLQQLKFSYNHLENERVKQCFLYCALWPEDYRIDMDNLIEFWIAEGLVEELESMQEEIDRGHTILNKLINNCLLENCETYDKPGVKLHDLVRDMALDITTKGKPRFLVRAGMQLKEIPHLKEWAEDLDKVSLMQNFGMEIPRQMCPPKCHALTTLLLASCYIRSIPECFFEQMHGLKILDLSQNPIKSLPNSISDLENLTTLRLASCDIKSIPECFFEQMHGLKILDLSGNPSQSLPNSISNLENLTKLLLASCKIRSIPECFFEQMHGLKILDLSQNPIESLSNSISDLENLTTLRLASCDIKSIPECFFEQMHGLKILDLSWNLIESLPNSICDLENLTALLLVGCDCSKNMPSFSKLRALEKLNLSETRIKNLPDGMERLVKLKYLNFRETRITKIPNGILSKFSCLQHLEGYDELEGRERFMRGDEIGGLRKLEIFKGRFRDMEELSNYAQALNGQTQGPREYHIVVGNVSSQFDEYKKRIELGDCYIYRNGAKLPSDVQELNIRRCNFEFGEELLFSRLIPLPHPTFSALTFINLYCCKKIKKLFSSDWVPKNLQNLEKLSVVYCDEMEEIIASSASELEEEGMDSSNTLNLALPKLSRLYLWGLPELKSIYSAKGTMACDSLQSVSISGCPKLKRIPLYLPLLEEGQPSPPLSLQRILMEPKESWENMEWDHPNAKSLLEDFVKFPSS